MYSRIATLTVLAVLGLAISSPAQEPAGPPPAEKKQPISSAGTFVELQNQLTPDGYVPTIDGQLVVRGKKADVVIWFLDSQGWGEAVVGFARDLTPGLGGSILVGVETGVEEGDGLWRVNPNLWFMRGPSSTFFSYEYGGSGYWYKLTSTISLNKRIALGAQSQAFYGHGPLAEFTFGQYKVWVSGGVRKDEKPQYLVGLVRNF